MGRGKIERVFETIQQQFLVEVTGDGAHPARHPVSSLEELNDLLDHWVRAVYHARVHSETGQAPAARWETVSSHAWNTRFISARSAIPFPSPASTRNCSRTVLKKRSILPLPSG